MRYACAIRTQYQDVENISVSANKMFVPHSHATVALTCYVSEMGGLFKETTCELLVINHKQRYLIITKLKCDSQIWFHS